MHGLYECSLKSALDQKIPRRAKPPSFSVEPMALLQNSKKLPQSLRQPLIPFSACQPKIWHKEGVKDASHQRLVLDTFFMPDKLQASRKRIYSCLIYAPNIAWVYSKKKAKYPRILPVYMDFQVVWVYMKR